MIDDKIQNYNAINGVSYFHHFSIKREESVL